MKKVMAMLTAVLLIMTVIPLSAFAATATSGTTGDCTWYLDGTVLTISGNGKMGDYTSAPAPWKSSGLTKVMIEPGVTTIGDYAFYRCSSLTNITIPDSVTTVGDYAFYSCSSLTSITIPDSVTTIGKYAFYCCPSLTNITIPNSVTTIGENAFCFCSSLTNITIPNSVTTIKNFTFYDCSNLTSITIPDGVTTIGDQAFYQCSKLESVTLGNSVTTIGGYAFYRCSSLTSITIPDSVTRIGVSAFERCSSLTHITIPGSVTTIGDVAFGYCSSLIAISVSSENPNYSSDDGVLFNKNKTKLIGCPGGKTGDYVILGSVTTIGDGAFSGCSSLTSITIPDSVTTIGESAFCFCSSLTSITIPDSVTTIGGWVFSYCSSLTSITIPDSVTTIGNYAFYDCSALTDIWYTGNESDQKGISIGTSNSALSSATWHYNCCSESMHTYDNGCDTTCNVCGYVRSVGPHVYDNDCDITCNICGAIRTVTHQYKTEWSKDGTQHWHECSVCGDKTNVESHRYDNACDATCNICGYIRQPDHVYDNACDALCNICSYVREVPDHVYEYNSGHTCGICGYSKAPIAPALESKTYNSVTLQKTEGFEYSKDGVVWQTDNVFSGLTENTVYTFYQRVKASDIAAQSEASDGLTVTVKRWQQTPAAPMILSYTDTTVVLVPTDGCEYSMDGEHWQNSNVFEGLSPASRYMFYQRRAETDSFEASPLSNATGIVTDKSKQTAVPSAPALYHAGADSIILVLADGCEYSMDGVNWQSSNVFEGLSVATEYTFYQRYKETDTTYAGKSSPAALFQTDKGAQTAPSAPVLERRTNYRVILEAVPGYEYSRDGVNWQSSNVFEGLEPETTYLFYQRKAENDRYYASDISAPLTVKTPEMPGDANDDGKINLDDVVVLAQYVAEWDIECNEAALDVNGDGVVNLDDIVHLAQYVAEWEGIVLG